MPNPVAMACMRLYLAACVLLVAHSALAQSNGDLQIVATSDAPANKGTSMTISRKDEMVPLAPVLPLTDEAREDVPPTGISGKIIDANPDNQSDIDSDDVALISCDDSAYPGNIQQTDVFQNAVNRNAVAVLLYSKEADYCQVTGDLGGYGWVFSMKSRNDTTNVLSAIADSSADLWVTIGGPDTQQGGSSNGRDDHHVDDPATQGPLGPNPSTAVAMIILYTITGIITALFLVIIITGAVRAHRHPERYGPRTIIGRPRQSRARGIGRAILDGIPIVKFGDREEPKPADVELGSTSTSSNPQTAREASAASENPPAPATTNNTDGAQPEDGIAAAGATLTSNATADNEETQGCSICTEDFERGQDQRVLPCDHRFHPQCVDPWLLNVSGTCPLCRVDLRPQQSRTSQDVDENGNPISREGEQDELGDLPPPIAERSSVRRSLMLGILGIRGRPDRMSTEERVAALRRYRQQQAARRRRDGEGAENAQTSEEQDRSTRRRMRNLLGVRTRRTGQAQDQQPAAAGEGSADADAPRDQNAEER